MAEKKKSPIMISAKGRLSYPSLFKKSDMSEKYEATLIWPDGTDLSELEAAIDAAAKSKWPEKLPANLRTPLKNCEDKVSENGPPAGYDQGGKYARFWSKTRRPSIVLNERDEDGRLKEAEEVDCYAGRWVKVSFTVFPVHNKDFKTNDVCLGLQNVVLLDDDAPFAGISSDPDSDFGLEIE